MIDRLIQDVAAFWRPYVSDPVRSAKRCITLRDGRLIVCTEMVGAGFDMDMSMHLCERGWITELEWCASVIYGWEAACETCG